MHALVKEKFIYRIGVCRLVDLLHTVVSFSACAAEYPGSIPGLDSINIGDYSLFPSLACICFLCLK